MAKYEVTVSGAVAGLRAGGKGTRTVAGIEFSRDPHKLDNPDAALLAELEGDKHLIVRKVGGKAEAEEAEPTRPAKKK